MRILFALCLLIFVLITAKGEVINKISALTAIKSGRYLTFHYRVGGGCQPHQSLIEVTSDDGVMAFVEVKDTSPKLDLCRALLFKSARIDFHRELLKINLPVDSPVYVKFQ